MTEFFTCPDCEQPTAPERDALCPSCSKWREQKFAEMDSDYQRQQARRERMRMSPGARFGEELADMVKAVERSKH
jgi:hypothetical protein